MKVTHGFVSFTEVEAGEHQSYNQWHLFDHMPEQYPLPGIVFGQRWVLSPELRPQMDASAPLDRTHYVTLYLMTEPIEETLTDFRALAVELREKDRFHLHRTSHLAGALAVTSCHASAAALVSSAAVPFRPNRGVHVVLTEGDADAVVEQAGVAGAWVLRADEHSPPELRNTTAVWYWLDDDPAVVAPQLTRVGGAYFSATFATVDPWSAWDWFDHG